MMTDMCALRLTQNLMYDRKIYERHNLVLTFVSTLLIEIKLMVRKYSRCQLDIFHLLMIILLFRKWRKITPIV